MQSRARAWKTCRRDGSFNRPGTRAVPIYSRSGAQSSRGHVIRSVKILRDNGFVVEATRRFAISFVVFVICLFSRSPGVSREKLLVFWNRRCLVRSGISLHCATFRSRSRLEHRIIRKLSKSIAEVANWRPLPPTSNR